MGLLTLSLLKEFAIRDTFIETGSQEGWTFYTAKEHGFGTMYGIELMEEFFVTSLNKFKDDENINLFLGESPDILGSLCPFLDKPATFWLDAHASGPGIPGGKYGGCPLVQELEAIKTSPCNTHVIMIDDVRLFGTSEWDFLPKEKVLEAIYNINPDYKIVYVDGVEDHAIFKNDILIASVFI